MVPEKSVAVRGEVDVGRLVEDVVGCKWSMRLLELVAGGTTRPSQLQRACPGLSTKVMNQRLTKLRRLGILQRTVRGTKPPLSVSYTLTPLGERFSRVVDEVKSLQRWVDESTAS